MTPLALIAGGNPCALACGRSADLRAGDTLVCAQCAVEAIAVALRPAPAIIDDADRDDLSIAILETLQTLAETIATAQRLGADVRALDERRVRYLALHRRVLGGES